eukprot:m.128742 g.128742  ORF g.128742 m.128742 type:complete len:145 (+) comp13876_c0_seq1:132-566(+)
MFKKKGGHKPTGLHNPDLVPEGTAQDVDEIIALESHAVTTARASKRYMEAIKAMNAARDKLKQDSVTIGQLTRQAEAAHPSQSDRLPSVVKSLTDVGEQLGQNVDECLNVQVRRYIKVSDGIIIIRIIIIRIIAINFQTQRTLF